ncbi:MAG: hypothetical protein AB7H80_04495 [Candidatus Kapaibacterium sp.]
MEQSYHWSPLTQLRLTLVLFPLMLLCSTYINLHAQSPQRLWSTLFVGNNVDILTSVSRDVNGDFYFGGYSKSTTGFASGKQSYEDFWIMKVDKRGKFRWHHFFDPGLTNYGTRLAVSPSGVSHLAGISSLIGPLTTEISITSFGPYGDQHETWWYGGSNNEFLHNIIPLHDGAKLLLGETSSTDGDVSYRFSSDYDAWVVRVSPGSAIKWESSFGGRLRDRAFDAIELADSSILVIGTIEQEELDFQGRQVRSWETPILRKYAWNGFLLWEKEFEQSIGSEGKHIEQLNDTVAVIAGRIRASNTATPCAYKKSNVWVAGVHTRTGKILWWDCVGSNGDDNVDALAVDSSGNLLMKLTAEANDGDFMAIPFFDPLYDWIFSYTPPTAPSEELKLNWGMIVLEPTNLSTPINVRDLAVSGDSIIMCGGTKLSDESRVDGWIGLYTNPLASTSPEATTITESPSFAVQYDPQSLRIQLNKRSEQAFFLFDIAGRTIRRVDIPSGLPTLFIQTSDLPHGTYILSLRTDSGWESKTIHL